MPLKIEGFLDDGHGEPLAGIPAVVTRLSDGAAVLSGATDADGHWVFTSLPTADEYVVTLSDSSGNAVSRAPWSGEMRELYVRDRLDVDGLPVLLDPAAGNALLWTATGLYAPTAAVTDLTNYYTKTEADALYLTSTEADALFLTQAEGDARYTQGGITQAAADTRYVNTTGDTLSGALDFGAVTDQQIIVNASVDGWLFTSAPAGYDRIIWHRQMAKALVLYNSTTATDLFTVSTGGNALIAGSLSVATKPVTISPDAANIVEWRANGFYAAAGAVSDIWVNTTGDTMTGDLNMAANVLPTTTNTRDLGSTSLRWRKVWATDADFTNAPTVGGAALLTSTTADALFLTPTEGNAAYVGLAGGSVMTGLLGPTTTNTRDLGTTALRWRKLWAVDGEFTNAPTVGGAALLTATAADALFLTPAEGNAAYATAAHNHDATYLKLTGGSLSGDLTISSAGRLLHTTTNPNPVVWTFSSTGGQEVATNSSAVNLLTTTNMLNAGTDQKKWEATHTATKFTWRVVNDAYNSAANFLEVTRSGATVTRLDLSATTVYVTTALQVNSRPVIMAGCRVTHNANQTITTGTSTTLAFNSERFDTDAYHDTVTNNSRLTVPAGLAGTYLVWAFALWGPGSDANYREINIRLNGSTIIGLQGGPALNSGALGTSHAISTVYVLAVGDYVELLVRQDRGSNLDILTAGNFTPEFGMQRIG